MSTIAIRFATAADVPLLLGFIKALARFENEPDAVEATPEDLLRDGFGERPRFEALIAERNDKPVGFALFFATYSTWAGRPSLYLEDLFVIESARKHGIGRALMAKLAALAVERGYRRLELQVLRWNPAREFYQRLGMGHMEEWLPYRLGGRALHALAAAAESSTRT